MTEEIFREDAYVKSCEAHVTAHTEDGVILDRTVFYPEGGGQPGDTGILNVAGGTQIRITQTFKGKGDVAGSIVHLIEEGVELPAIGDSVTVELDWDRRYAHMRMHTLLHLMLSLVNAKINGAAVGAVKSRMDFDLGDLVLDKEHLTEELNRLITEDHSVRASWISDQELEERPELVRTMSVQPPTGHGMVRLMEIDQIDLQPCGGTHVLSTSEIGRVKIGKIENKGKHNRRVNLVFDND